MNNLYSSIPNDAFEKWKWYFTGKVFPKLFVHKMGYSHEVIVMIQSTKLLKSLQSLIIPQLYVTQYKITLELSIRIAKNQYVINKQIF